MNDNKCVFGENITGERCHEALNSGFCNEECRDKQKEEKEKEEKELINLAIQ